MVGLYNDKACKASAYTTGRARARMWGSQWGRRGASREFSDSTEAYSLGPSTAAWLSGPRPGARSSDGGVGKSFT